MGKSTAVVWRYGPDGEFGRGEVNSERFWGRFWTLVIVTSIASYFTSRYGIGAVIILVGTIYLRRLACFTGSPGYLSKFDADELGKFGAACLGLFVVPVFVHFRYDDQQWSDLAATLGAFAFLGFFLFYNNLDRLWDESASVLGKPSVSGATLSEIQAMAGKIREDVSALKNAAPDNLVEETEKTLNVLSEARDVHQISNELRRVNSSNQQLWSETVECHNRARQYHERALLTLRTYIDAARSIASAAPIDKQKVEEEAAKRVHAEMTRIIAPHLTSKGINAGSAGIYRVGGKALSDAVMGKTHPAIAVALVATSIIVDQIYKSRVLRQLKDTQGEVLQALQSICGDRDAVVALIQTRYEPDLQLICEVCTTLGTYKDFDNATTTTETPALTEFVIAHRMGERILQAAKD